MRERLIYSAEDVLSMLDDLLAGRDGSWWDGFYADRAKPVPFFAERPDENLVEWFAQDLLGPGALKPAGSYGLVCFRPEGGSGLSDQEVYERRGLAGRLGYSRERLLALWGGRLEILQLRQMVKTSGQAKQFGEDFLWVLLARKAKEERG